MSFIAGLGGGLLNVVGQIQDRLEGIVSTIINFLRNLVNNVYIWFLRLWNFCIENPRGAVLMFANVWVMMV